MECIAPWKMMLAPDHRTARNLPGLRASTSCPSSSIVPSIFVFDGSSRRMAPAMVDLPQPDSPARPTTSPFSICRSTPRTAGTAPEDV